MYCPKCGTQLPDSAAFCMKCGTNIAGVSQETTKSKENNVLAPSDVKALNCPSCGAPLTPQFGEMVITCEYCGTGISLSNEGWRGIQKQSMLPVKFSEKSQVEAEMRGLMDKGLLHRHLQESSKLEELNLSLVPYWIVDVSARTSVLASDIAMDVGKVATTAALFGLMGAAMGGGRGRGFGAPVLTGALLGTAMTGGGGSSTKSFDFADNYNFPIVALKTLSAHQPKEYQFNLSERVIFDVSKVPKDVKVLNGDVGEEAAKYQAKSLVTQLQSEKAHAKYHMIQRLQSEVDVSEAELLHAPIWFARYDWNGKKVSLVIDANSGGVINSIGL
jgi:zinc-ribbon domain